jgi:Domain of unknown function (DUF4149)
MLALRYAAVLALAFWIGGLAVLGALAAPAAFDVLAARAADGRAAAGAVVGETLRRFHLAAYFCAAVVVLSLAVRGVLGPRPRPFGIRVATAAIMIGATAYSGLVLSPKITQSQRTLGISPSTLPADDPRRAEFNRLHSRSVYLQLVPLLGGLVLLFWEMKD